MCLAVLHTLRFEIPCFPPVAPFGFQLAAKGNKSAVPHCWLQAQQ
eukprot:COSAG02_NODE_39659_length_414_cov_1.028571_1_plen_44_part_10